MFTGIIEETGKIKSITSQAKGTTLEVATTLVILETKIGDSIAVNGCCLTVVKINDTSLHFDIVEETMLKTNFKYLQVDNSVNLERAIKMHDRLGGHLVQGHIDGIGYIENIESLEDGSMWVTIQAPDFILRYLILKGSITIEGVSLTIAKLTPTTFSFAMIPYTAKITALGDKRIHDPINIEVDMMAKYIERLLTPIILKR